MTEVHRLKSRKEKGGSFAFSSKLGQASREGTRSQAHNILKAVAFKTTGS